MIIIFAIMVVIVLAVLKLLAANQSRPCGKQTGLWYPESKRRVSRRALRFGRLDANCDAAWFRAAFGALFYNRRELINRFYYGSTKYG